jgi:hypothetical protein
MGVVVTQNEKAYGGISGLSSCGQKSGARPQTEIWKPGAGCSGALDRYQSSA